VDARVAHNKIVILGGAVVITGSFNFSNAAEESNAENLLVIRDQPDLVWKCVANSDAHRAHSQVYEPVRAPEARQKRAKMAD